MNTVFTQTKIPGVFCGGIQYYDLKNIGYLNHTEAAQLIRLMKSHLEAGADVQFINVNVEIKRKIKSMGLNHILNCT